MCWTRSCLTKSCLANYPLTKSGLTNSCVTKYCSKTNPELFYCWRHIVWRSLMWQSLVNKSTPAYVFSPLAVWLNVVGRIRIWHSLLMFCWRNLLCKFSGAATCCLGESCGRNFVWPNHFLDQILVQSAFQGNLEPRLFGKFVAADQSSEHRIVGSILSMCLKLEANNLWFYGIPLNLQRQWPQGFFLCDVPEALVRSPALVAAAGPPSLW